MKMRDPRLVGCRFHNLSSSVPSKRTLNFNTLPFYLSIALSIRVCKAYFVSRLILYKPFSSKKFGWTNDFLD